MTPHLTLSRKILSILLSILLVVAFVPAVAFAGNDANDEVVAFDEDVADRSVYDADDSFGGVDDSDFGGVDSSGDTDGSGDGTEITTWPDPSGSDNGTTENNQGTQEGKELKENSWRYTNGELTVSDESEDAGIEAYSTRSNSNKRPVARGIDVSEHNGTINWNAVKNSGQVDFAILRVGYGDDCSYQDDKQWARNVSECERLGIPYGVYIYSYATSWSQLNSEVSHVKRLLKGHNPSYPVYIDMEDDSTIGLGRNTLTQFAKSFCDQINSAGYTAGVYANLNWWNNYLYASQLDNYERWVAQYNSSCWYEGDYSLWQYSSSGSVPGISGNVDMNYCYKYFDEERYSAVYDFEYYKVNNPDVDKAFSGNRNKIFQHFVNYGMNEGRQGNETFDATSYYNEYSDLRAVYGANLKKYYEHYIKYGQKEGRNGIGCSDLKGCVAKYNGVDYSAVYDGSYYAQNNGDVVNWATFGPSLVSDQKLIQHFVNYGMNEGRQGNETFDVTSYYNEYSDLRAAYGANLKKYYEHYIKYGQKEGRNGIGCSALLI